MADSDSIHYFSKNFYSALCPFVGNQFAYTVSKKDTLASSKKVHTCTILLSNIQYSELASLMKYRCCYLTAEPATTTSKIEASGF
jgi:hypothetical protein